jgi:hypothetical protein
VTYSNIQEEDDDDDDDDDASAFGDKEAKQEFPSGRVASLQGFIKWMNNGRIAFGRLQITTRYSIDNEHDMISRWYDANIVERTLLDLIQIMSKMQRCCPQYDEDQAYRAQVLRLGLNFEAWLQSWLTPGAGLA